MMIVGLLEIADSRRIATTRLQSTIDNHHSTTNQQSKILQSTMLYHRPAY
jgi:hypothetical protein